MNVTITPQAGTISFTSGDPPRVTIVALRLPCPVFVLKVRARPPERRTQLIHGPPKAA